MIMNSIIIDASVLTDMCLMDRERHTNAVALVKHIQENNIQLTIPMHAILEVKSSIGQERSKPGSGIIDPGFYLKINEIIPIDNNFINEYMDLSLPHIKAGDLIYILIAKKKNIPLITEDDKQLRVANKSGVAAYKINEFLGMQKKYT